MGVERSTVVLDPAGTFVKVLRRADTHAADVLAALP